MILTRDWRNGDTVHLKRKKFRDILRAVQELEKRGYSCVHPIRSLVQRQKEFVHKRTERLVQLIIALHKRMLILVM
ncbi:hypothetical protein ABEO76_22360 [Bacillus anthracis]|uniref:hypothetical protein n=1 Tax=Bacillus anthracis TaxID=1392 RepID=UPI003D1E7895